MANHHINGMFPGETVEEAAERWAAWCDTRSMTMLPEFLRFIARDTEPLSDERIDYIADKVIKAMPEGIRGFCRVWGWQQFARELLDVCGARARDQARSATTEGRGPKDEEPGPKGAPKESGACTPAWPCSRCIAGETKPMQFGAAPTGGVPAEPALERSRYEPTSWDLIRAAEDVGLEGLTVPYLSDGDRKISEAGKTFIKGVRSVLNRYTRPATPAAQPPSSAQPHPLEAPMADPVGREPNTLGVPAQAPSRSPSQAPPIADARSATDYALEFAENLATAAEEFIAALDAEDELRLRREERDDVDEDTMYDARQTGLEHRSGLQSAIYEFRKRRDRARDQARSATTEGRGPKDEEPGPKGAPK